MFPRDAWCKLSCISVDQSCIFENSCGYRKIYLRAFQRKRDDALKRGVKYGIADDLTTNNLVILSKQYLLNGFKCHYCKEEMRVGGKSSRNTCTLDHKVALINGGTHDLNNIVLCCWGCNIKKGDK